LLASIPSDIIPVVFFGLNISFKETFAFGWYIRLAAEIVAAASRPGLLPIEGSRLVLGLFWLRVGLAAKFKLLVVFCTPTP